MAVHLVDEDPEGNVSANQPKRLKVTMDGGASWEDGPVSPISRGSYVPRFAGGGTLFLEEALPRDEVGGQPFTLYRRSGPGRWQKLFASAYQFEHSPRFLEDGTAIVTDGNRLHRTTDGGATWSLIADFKSVTDVAAPPALFGRGIILVAASGDLYRTTDSGATWHRVYGGEAGFPALWFDLYTSVHGDDVLHVRDERSQVRLASADAGETWHTTPEPIQFIERPQRHATGDVMFARATRGTMLRSTDGGATWYPMDLPVLPEHALGPRPWWSFEFSPNYAEDRTVVAWTDSGDTARAGQTALPSAFISSDAGENWASLPMLEHAGVSYNRVKDFGMSDNFPHDGAMIALAEGVLRRGGPCDRAVRFPHSPLFTFTAVFRSVDRGQTWEPAVTEEDICGRPGIGAIYLRPETWLSGSLWHDGLGLITWAYSSTRTEPGACYALLTSDAGATWQPHVVSASARCLLLWRGVRQTPRPTAARPAQLTVAVTFGPDATDGEFVRFTRGTAAGGWYPWATLRAPGDSRATATYATYSPAFEEDASLIVGTLKGEVWSVALCACDPSS